MCHFVGEHKATLSEPFLLITTMHLSTMNEFSQRIACRRIAQCMTGRVKARDIGYANLMTTVKEAIAISISTDADTDSLYNNRLQELLKLICSHEGFESDLVQKVLVDYFLAEIKWENTSVLQMLRHYTYMICELFFINLQQ